MRSRFDFLRDSGHNGWIKKEEIDPYLFVFFFCFFQYCCCASSPPHLVGLFDPANSYCSRNVRRRHIGPGLSFGSGRHWASCPGWDLGFWAGQGLIFLGQTGPGGHWAGQGLMHLGYTGPGGHLYWAGLGILGQARIWAFYQLINYDPDKVGPDFIRGPTKLQNPNQSGLRPGRTHECPLYLLKAILFQDWWVQFKNAKNKLLTPAGLFNYTSIKPTLNQFSSLHFGIQID